MKVKDLIKQLNKLNPNSEAYCYEDGPVPIKGLNSGLFDIVRVEEELVTLSGHSNSLNLILEFDGEASRLTPCILIGITPEF